MYPSRLHIASRIAAALGGGYAFTWGFIALGIVAGVAAGIDYEEAQTTMALLAFLVFLGIFLWAFAARSLLRVWVVLAGGGALMTGIAWWATQRLA